MFGGSGASQIMEPRTVDFFFEGGMDSSFLAIALS
jgi:hypothetical protein